MDWTGRLMIVAPHPDDEAIGAGGHLADVPDAWVVLVTDGAPRNPLFAQRSGFSSREAYAEARRKEIEAALQVAGMPLKRMISFGMMDQESALQLVELTNRLAGVFDEVRPDTVLTPAYEGGHPDHDSAAFGVRLASRMMPPGRAPGIFEYALYNAGGGQYSTGRFLENSDAPVETVELAEHGMSIKKRMYDCYVTQRTILDRFDVHRERFRKAPEYDFERPPHEGPLYYDKYNWDVTGEKWRALAREAHKKL